MSPAQRRYLILEQGVGGAVVNFFINAVIAWAMFRTMPVVPLWGQQSIMGDTIGTCFFLPLITCLILTRLARGHVRAGHVMPVGWARVHPLVVRLPRGTAARGAVLGIVCILLFAPLAWMVLVALDVTSLPFWRFVAFKGGFAAFAAALVSPVIALWAIAEPQAA